MPCQQADNKRVEGLKILARMIAAAHKRRLREANRQGSEFATSAVAREEGYTTNSKPRRDK